MKLITSAIAAASKLLSANGSHCAWARRKCASGDRPVARVGDLPVRWIDPRHRGRRRARDQHFGEGAVAAADVDPVKVDGAPIQSRNFSPTR